MTDYYFDTSALVKYYRIEIGSRQVNQIINDPNNVIYISELTIIEFASACEQLRQMGQLDQIAFKSALAQFAANMGNMFVIVNFHSDWIELAKDLVLQHNLRTLDSLQLAAALSLKTLTFTLVCADGKLLKVAQAVGLKVFNPM